MRHATVRQPMNSEPVVEESPFKGQTGLRRVWNAFNYSLAGLHAAYVNEDAFRQESLLAALMIPVALVLPPSRPRSTGFRSTGTSCPSAPRTSAARRC
jgi:hypothetical protein